MRKRKLPIGLAAALTALIGIGWTLAASPNSVYLPVVVTAPDAQNPLHSGQATYYDKANGSGSCSFAPIPGDLMVAAISYLEYSDPQESAYCGAYAEVTGPKGTITVRIVDICPDPPDDPDNATTGCGHWHLDLSPTAFDMIAEHHLGRVPITWRVVSPELSGPIVYHFKDKSNPWWTAVQIRNHRNPIAKFEYKNSAGQWVEVERLSYNYFVKASGMGAGPYSFRVTDVYDNVLIDTGIVGGDDVSRSGAKQFPKGP